MNYGKKTTPSTPLIDQRFEYRNSAATDVTLTWRKFGWKPKEEQNEITSGNTRQIRSIGNNTPVR